MSEGGAARRKVVLVVDDEPANVDYVVRCLRSVYQCLSATSGADALALLRAEAVDLIISDMRMPGMNGAELLAEARALNPVASRIVLSAYSDPQDLVPAVNGGGAQRYVQKPVSPTDLRAVAAELIAEAEARETSSPEAEDGSMSGTRWASNWVITQDRAETLHLVNTQLARARRFGSPVAVGLARVVDTAAPPPRVASEPGVGCLWGQWSERCVVVLVFGGVGDAAARLLGHALEQRDAVEHAVSVELADGDLEAAFDGALTELQG